MRRVRGLSLRLLIAIGTLAVLHLAVFVTLVVALHNLRTADGGARDVGRVASVATDLRFALADLEAAERGVVIAHGRGPFVAAWHRSATQLTRSATALAASGGPTGRALAVDARLYLAASSRPIVTLADSKPATARQLVSPGAGEPRTVTLAARLDRFVRTERSARKAQRDHASWLAGIAQVVGFVGILATLVCAIGFVAYVRRAIMAPLGRVAEAARALAAGDLRTRVAKQDGVGEVAELAHTFDRMAASLEDNRLALERQNAELADQSVELVEAVRSAREGASVLRAVLDATPDAIALLDSDGAVLVDNPPMRAVRREGLLALEDHDASAELRDEITLQDARRAFARYAAPVRDGRGQPIGQLLVLREITAEREAEQAKEDFLALVSHELRTPLTAILGYVELVLGDDGEELRGEHARHLAVVERNARRLLRLVGDLLFAAEVERGSLLLEPGTVDIAQVVHDALELARPRAEEEGIALIGETCAPPPCLGDRDRLAQVLDNLVSNALKFTQPGGQVDVRLTQAGGRACLEVQDTGVGIPADDLPRLYDRFFRAANATTRAVPGLGLGLMIARAIVEGHGGTIAVASTLGVGTTVTVELPLHPLAGSGAAATEAGGYPAGGR